MSRPELQQILDDLTRGLRPVRPVLRLRVAGAVVLGIAVALAVGILSRGALRPDAAELLASGGAFAFVGLGLVITGLGGTLGALASRVPGRERPAVLGAIAAIAGSTLALAAATSALLASGPLREALGASPPIAADIACLLKGGALGLVPTLAGALLVARGSLLHVQFAAVALGAGGAALGAVIVHLSCPADGARHILASHAGPPILGALLLAPLGWLLGRRRRSAR